MYEIEVYRTESGNAPLKKYMQDILDKRHGETEYAKIQLFIDHLQEYGLAINDYFPRSMKHLRDKIYELRPDNNRVLFFYQNGEGKFVLLHGFQKKTQKTPPKEIDKAIAEYKDYIRRNGNG